MSVCNSNTRGLWRICLQFTVEWVHQQACDLTILQIVAFLGFHAMNFTGTTIENNNNNNNHNNRKRGRFHPIARRVHKVSSTTQGWTAEDCERWKQISTSANRTWLGGLVYSHMHYNHKYIYIYIHTICIYIYTHYMYIQYVYCIQLHTHYITLCLNKHIYIYICMQSEHHVNCGDHPLNHYESLPSLIPRRLTKRIYWKRLWSHSHGLAPFIHGDTLR